MKKIEKNKYSLLALGGLDILWWLLSKGKKGKCPRCNYPVTDKTTQCPNCGKPLNWRDFK